MGKKYSTEEAFPEARKGEMKYIISKIAKFKRRFKLTPEQNRYVDKQVREMLNLQIQKRPKRLPNFLNPGEIDVFLKVARETGLKHSMLARVLIFTGLRIGEVRNLDVRDLDFGNNQLKVILGKGKKDRYVSISSGLLDHVKQYIGDRTRGNVFVNRKGTKYTKRMLQYMVEKIINKCQFTKDLSTHSLRHTFACMCISKGLRLEEIQILMGHDRIETTQIYARLELGTIKEKYLQIMGVE